MKLERTRNSERNIIFGTINRLLAYVIPFVIRTLLIRILGTEYLGLNSLFTSVLQVLSLTELGFGTAIVYSMYQSVADDDIQQINKLLNFYRKIYFYVGIIILIVGCILIPFLPYLVDGTIPDGINLTLVYIVYLLNTVASYIFFAYKRSVFGAYQRLDIDDNISSILHLLIYPAEAVILIVTKNYYLFILMTPVMTVFQNFICSVVVDRRYPQIKAKGELSKEDRNELINKTKNLFVHRVGNTLSTSFDSIIVSSVFGLSMLAIYSNYNYVITVIIGFMTIAYGGVTAGIGNSLITETKEHNKQLFKRLDFMNSWVVIFCTTCLVCLYQPFMHIWVGDENSLDIVSAILFSTFFYIFTSRKIVLTYKDAAGLWEPDRLKPIVGGIVNLVLNIVLSHFIGVNGVIISTIISYLFIEIPWENHVFFRRVFHESERWYYVKHFGYTVSCIAVVGVTYFICHRLERGNLISFLEQIAVCAVVPNVLFFLLYRRSVEMEFLKEWLASHSFLRKVSMHRLEGKNKIQIKPDGGAIQRDSNFELLRILSVHGIVLMHLLAPYLIQSSGVTKVFVILVNSIANCGVSLFELTSGYFGVRHNTNKVCKYWTITVFYSLVAIGANYLLGNGLSVMVLIKSFLPISYFGNWYMVCYILLVIFADYINLIPERLSKKLYENLLLVGFILLYVFPVFTQSSFAPDNGKGVINFIFMYLVGRYIRLYGKNWRNTKNIVIIALLSLGVGCVLNFGASYFAGGEYSVHLPFAHDNSMFIAIGSVCILLLFRMLKFKSKIINFISKYTIGIFMLNPVVIQVASEYIRYDKFEDTWYYFVIIIGMSILIMIVCLVFDFIRNSVFNWVERMIVSIEESVVLTGYNFVKHIIGRMFSFVQE